MLLSNIILQSAKAALVLQSNEGAFPAGCNGPYHDPETSVRNTAHWLITLLKAYEISGDQLFKEAALLAVKYLLSPSSRPMNATFFCRKNPERDFCNGLIGQAWIIEALAIAGEKLNDPQLARLGHDVFVMHPFDQKIGLWRRVNVDGSYLGFDYTFNHQLWFAAAGALLGNNEGNTIRHMIEKFLDCASESHLKINSEGRIIHGIAQPVGKIGKIRNAIYSLRNPGRNSEINDFKKERDTGYHAFNMYAFSILRQYIPEHPLWQSAKFRATLEYMNKEEFINGMDNKYGYPYNPCGFEVAFTIQEFKSFLLFSKSEEWWVEQQLLRSYSTEKNMMNRNTEDKETLSARLYEATRLKDMKITSFS